MLLFDRDGPGICSPTNSNLEVSRSGGNGDCARYCFSGIDILREQYLHPKFVTLLGFHHSKHQILTLFSATIPSCIIGRPIHLIITFN